MCAAARAAAAPARATAAPDAGPRPGLCDRPLSAHDAPVTAGHPLRKVGNVANWITPKLETVDNAPVMHCGCMCGSNTGAGTGNAD